MSYSHRAIKPVFQYNSFDSARLFLDMYMPNRSVTWWRHQMETLSVLLTFVLRIQGSPVNSPYKRPVTRSFDVFFDLFLNKRLSKQSRPQWFETPSHSLWRHCDAKAEVFLTKDLIPTHWLSTLGIFCHCGLSSNVVDSDVLCCP